ncbi:MAG: hypothetical protein R2734_04070 [Nocardioides sp.]
MATRADASLADLAAEPGESSLDVLTLGHLRPTCAPCCRGRSVDALSAEAAGVRADQATPGSGSGGRRTGQHGGGSLRESRAAVAELARANLVTVRRPGRIVLRPRVGPRRRAGRDRADPEEREAARSRLVDHLLHSAVGATAPSSSRRCRSSRPTDRRRHPGDLRRCRGGQRLVGGGSRR